MKKIIYALFIVVIQHSTLSIQNSFAQTPNDSKGAGNGLDFDGINDYVSCGSSSSIDNTFAGGGTLTAWIKPNSATSNRAFVSKIGSDNVGWVIYLSQESVGKSKVTFVYTGPIDRNYISVNRDVQMNEWSAISVTYDKDNFSNFPTMYVNGEVIAGVEEFNEPNATMDNDAPKVLTIGNTVGSSGSAFFDGEIDEVRLWNRTLTQQEIRDNMNKKLTGNETGLVGYWNMNEGTGNTVSDLTSNANHGTRQ